jgi:hypothetical protein
MISSSSSMQRAIDLSLAQPLRAVARIVEQQAGAFKVTTEIERRNDCCGRYLSIAHS